MLYKFRLAVARWLFHQLGIADRVSIARDLLDPRDLAQLLPPAMLVSIAFNLTDRTPIRSLGVAGSYGLIEGSVSDQVILREYAQSGTWSPQLQDTVIADIFGERQGTFIDVGANIGLTSIPVARHHGVKCIAIEPDPANYKYLKNNISTNGLEDLIDTLNCAAYDGDATLDFELSADNFGDHRIRTHDKQPLVVAHQAEDARATIKIQAYALDALISDERLKHPVLMKVDTQGSEPMVFKGAQRILLQVDCLVVEFSPYTLARAGYTAGDFFAWLPDFDFAKLMSFDKHTGLDGLQDKELTMAEIRQICTARMSDINPDVYFDIGFYRNRAVHPAAGFGS